MTTAAGLLSTAPGATKRRTVTSTELEEFHRSLFLPLVRRATWKHGLSKEDACDVVQEAFLLAMAKMNPDGNPKAWLNQVVDHLSMNLRRTSHRRAELVARWGPRPEHCETEGEGQPGCHEAQEGSFREF